MFSPPLSKLGYDNIGYEGSAYNSRKIISWTSKLAEPYFSGQILQPNVF